MCGYNGAVGGQGKELCDGQGDEYEEAGGQPLQISSQGRES